MQKNAKQLNIKHRNFWQTHPAAFGAVVFLAYTVLQCVAHWSLVLGQNLMKWDIWQAHYPATVMMGDALRGGTIPMWNPLMLFGVPYYTIVGMPVWYPTTLLFAWLGYTPTLLNIEYVLHTVLAAFGAFLFIKQQMKNSAIKKEICIPIAFLAGLLYGNSGVFLSNAQHIMIIISATWIPYVLYAYQKYLEENKPIHLMLSAGFAALIFFGGYPELFYYLFVFLVPFTVYVNYKKEKSVLYNIGNSALKYIFHAVLTVAASAALLIPFICSMSSLARTNDMGTVPVDMNPVSIFTTLMPGVSSVLPDEPSMGVYYVGVFTLVILPLIFKSKYKDKWFYCISTAAFFVLNLGDGAFFHSFLYRFFPMFTSFRFPTISRCFMALFLLVVAANLWSELLDSLQTEKIESKPLVQLSKILTVSLLCCFAAASVLLYVLQVGAENAAIAASIKIVLSASFYGALIALSYFVFFRIVHQKLIKQATACVALAGMVCFETFTFVYAYTPLTIARYSPTQSMQKIGGPETKEEIDFQKAQNSQRNRSIDFSQAVRTQNKLDSQKIVFDKTFDKNGYLSFVLVNTDRYLDSYNHMITDENPVVYFTSNVVNETMEDLESWMNNPAVTPDQIYVENGILPKTEVEVGAVAKPNQIQSDLASITKTDGMVHTQYPATQPMLGTEFYKLRVYLEESNKETVDVQLVFNPDSNPLTIAGNYHVYNKETTKPYIDVYYPDADVSYSQTDITMAEEISSVESLKMSRTAESKNVTIDAFSFNHIEITVDAPKDGYLTVMQLKYPGWNVKVDGEKANIETINGTFMGVALEQGTHHIVFDFEPMDFFIGIAITMLFGVAFIIVLVYPFFAKNANKKVKTNRKK